MQPGLSVRGMLPEHKNCFASLSLKRTKIKFIFFDSKGLKDACEIVYFLTVFLISAIVICFVYFEKHFVVHFISLQG